MLLLIFYDPYFIGLLDPLPLTLIIYLLFIDLWSFFNNLAPIMTQSILLDPLFMDFHQLLADIKKY